MLIHIEYELSFAAPFHFGVGSSTTVLDRTVIRDAHKYLYVPASTIKGVLREHCEHLLRFVRPAGTEEVVSPHDANAVLVEFGSVPTLISRIFGSQLYPGTLHFADARQDQSTTSLYSEMQTSVLTQVRIDRLTRTAADEALYTSEFGNRALTFRGMIKGQLNCDPLEDFDVLVEEQGEVFLLTPTYSLFLLLAGLLMIERIGGNKSTGKGACRCTILEVYLDRHKCAETDWRHWIGHLEVLCTYKQKEEGGRV